MTSAATSSGIRESGEKALAAIDRVLAERPKSVQPACLEVTHRLVHLRDTLISELRTNSASPVSAHLEHANALLSLVFSIQYPLEGVPWEKLKQARDALHKLLAESPRGD